MIHMSFFPYDQALNVQQMPENALDHWSGDMAPRKADCVWIAGGWHAVHSVWWRGPHNAACFVMPLG